MVQDDLEQSIRNYLQSGEHIRWMGRPAQGLRTSAQDVFMIPFSLFWCGFVVFWEVSVTRTGAGSFFELWGVPFICVGLYMVVGRFFVDAWVRGRTAYALTERRALILRRVLSDNLLSANLDGNVRLNNESGDRGTIEFGPELPYFARSRSWSRMTPSLSGQVCFIGIPDVKTVYRQAGASPSV